MSLRRAVARTVDGGDLQASVAAYAASTLPSSVKVALRLADAYLADPAGLGDRGRREASKSFTPDQIVELVLKLLAFSSNKTAVALSLDAPASFRGLSSIRYVDGVPEIAADPRDGDDLPTTEVLQ
jgi:hypothetical protein